MFFGVLERYCVIWNPIWSYRVGRGNRTLDKECTRNTSSNIYFANPIHQGTFRQILLSVRNQGYMEGFTFDYSWSAQDKMDMVGSLVSHLGVR